MAGFLVIVGLTGSILVFNVNLERVFAHSLFATPRPGVPRLDLSELAERAGQLVPHGRVYAVWMTEDDQASIGFTARTDSVTGQPYDLGFDEFFVDPWTGNELGRRHRGDLSEGLINLVPFIYELHWTLALGDVGQWILGILALVWTLDCFVGIYLALPLSRPGFWRRLRMAYRVKRGARGFRLHFDLHRATGLWVWPLLVIFGWSSVMMNVRPIYEAVTSRVFDYESLPAAYTTNVRPNDRPRLGWREAERIAERLMAEQARVHGVTVGKPLTLMYFSDIGDYLYEVRGSGDVFERSPKGGGTEVMLDGDTGELRDFSQPTGEHVGNTIESWLYALHMTRVFGMPYRILVCVLGGLVALLSVTGVVIWWKKRQAPRLARAMRVPAAE